MKKTFCNPLNINYQYQRPMGAREAADPAVVIFRGEYYLFASHSSGYWVSPDLVEWEFLRVDVEKHPQFDLYAPATLALGDRLYVTHGQGGHLLYTETPRDPDSWVDMGAPLRWNDPALFADRDGRVYAYEGLSPTLPLHAMELAPEDLCRLVAGPVDVFQSDSSLRGFERPGDVNQWSEGRTFLEGAWMNRIGDRYYLTYAVPGTEFAGYCDGCAVGDSPMGPFTFCENSPVVYKATGFMRGAGHGCLFRDLKGNLWKMDTVSVSVNHPFERRLCLFPATVTAEGRLYVNAYRGDYPMVAPHETDHPFTEADAGWQLLSYGKVCSASSVLDEAHAPARAFDENLRTCWAAATGEAGEWLEADLGQVCEARGIQVNFGDVDILPAHGRDNGFAYRYLLEASVDGETWFILTDRRESTDDLPHEYIPLESPVPLRHIRLTNSGPVPAGGKFAVSGLRVFGHGAGEAPAAPPVFTATRHADPRDMTVTWAPVEGARGYIIRWGLREGELHTHWQVMEDCEATVHCLTAGVSYLVTVDAFNEGGVTRGTETQRI